MEHVKIIGHDIREDPRKGSRMILQIHLKQTTRIFPNPFTNRTIEKQVIYILLANKINWGNCIKSTSHNSFSTPG